MDLRLVDAYLAAQEWFRQTTYHGEVWLGQQRYNVGKRWGKTEVAIRYDPLRCEIVCRPGGGEAVTRFAIKGLTVPDLMGAVLRPQTLPIHQLVLPFPQDVWYAPPQRERLPATAA